jgi:hypothetical protein
MKFLANLNAKYQVVCKLYLLRYLAWEPRTGKDCNAATINHLYRLAERINNTP